MKRVTALFTALILIVGLCACSKKVEEPTWQEQYDLGVRYLSEGNYQEAIIAFTAAIEIDEMGILAYLGRGDSYIELLEYAKAKSDYLVALEMDPSISETYLKLSQLYSKMKRLNAAINILYAGICHCQDTNELLLTEYRKILVPIARQECYRPDGTLEQYFEFSWDSKMRILSRSRFAYLRKDPKDGTWADRKSNDGEWTCEYQLIWNYDDVQQTIECSEWTYIRGIWAQNGEKFKTGDNVTDANYINSAYCSCEIGPYFSGIINPYSYQEFNDSDTAWLSDSYRPIKYAIATYNDMGLITRIDSYDEHDLLIGYVIVEYAQN